jgi:cysteine desulfurase/selenocysteine lyase
VRELECDFLAFSGHKMYGPTGIGVLWGSASWLDRLPPYQGGGDMIRTVTFAESTFADLPHKFEAGTPHIAGAIGLGAAVDFLSGLDREAVREHEQDLLQYAQDALGTLTGVRLVGTAEEKESVVSFVIAGVHAHDVGTLLDREGIAVRAGHHCAQPVMERFGVPATARCSFALYNTRDEIDRLRVGVERIIRMFS